MHELGDRLEPQARALVKMIVAGTAGDVPEWAYKMLARFPEQSLAVLTPCLKDKELTKRERAAVALGYMGRAAAAARPRVTLALKGAHDEREQRLLKWCHREIE